MAAITGKFSVKEIRSVPFGKQTADFFISQRFQRVVTLHILKNLLRRVEVQVPLLLGIHGPSGEGKTFQCEHVLKKMGVKRYLISGGQLDSPISGQPAQLIRSTYIRASESMERGECSMAVVLINDVDTGLGSWKETPQFTMNQQTLFGELMHLVDYPNSVEGKETLRVPVIITGNDFTKLYAPLVRAGRMAAFQWLPTLEERSEIIAAIFPELSKDECKRLVSELTRGLEGIIPDPTTGLPVAFFAHLRANLLDEDLWSEVERSSVEKLVDTILRGEEPDFSLGIHYDRVHAKGLELAQSGQLINHVKNGEK